MPEIWYRLPQAEDMGITTQLPPPVVSPSSVTLPLALNYFTSQFTFNYAAMFAGITMAVLPSILIYVLLQEQVTSSMIAGSPKG